MWLMQAIGCKLIYPLSFELSFCPSSLNSHIHSLHVYICLLGPFLYALMCKTCILCSKKQKKCIWSHDVVYKVPRALKRFSSCSSHTVRLKEFKQICRQFCHSHALDGIHRFLTEFATRLSLVTGRPKAQRTRAVHTAAKASVKLCFILFLLPGYSLLASLSVFSFFSLSLTSTVICFCGSLKMPFPGNDEIWDLQSVDSRLAEAEGP